MPDGLQRRTELRRTGPPQRRTELARTGGPERKSPLRAQSAKRKPTSDQVRIRHAVHERDGRRCRLQDSSVGSCWKRLTVHHLLKAGQGGPFSMLNLVTLCPWHNQWVECDRQLANTWGLYVSPMSQGTFTLADPGKAWERMILFELVDYWWDGTPASRPRPDARAAT